MTRGSGDGGFGDTGSGGALIGGRYRLVRQIGRGGMGTVWQAHDLELDRLVAIKQLAPPPGVPDEARAGLIERVRREARLAARLDHPGIVRVHDVIDWAGMPAIVMEYVEGRSLAAHLRESGPMPVADAARLGAALLDALRHAHAAGVVHRDLKPDNILQSGQRAVITDFGIARPLDEATLLTMAGTVIGTPAYMSPEQIDGNETTPASDLWSFGVTLYSAVEGALPFDGDMIGQVFAAVLTRPMRPPRNAGPLTALLEALLTKDPDQRATAESAALRLAAIIDGDVDGGGAPAKPQHATAQLTRTTSGSLRRNVRRPRFYVPAMAVVAALGITAAIVIPGVRGTSDPSPSTATKTPTPGATLFSNGRLAASFTQPTDQSAISVAFAPHSGMLAIGSDKATTSLWNTATGQRVLLTDKDGESSLQQGVDEGLVAVAFSPDGKTLATADEAGDGIYLWNAATGKLKSTLTDSGAGCVFGVDALAFAPSGTTLAVSSDANNGGICLFDVATGKVTSSFADPDDGSANALAFSPNGATLVAADSSGNQGTGNIYLWNVATEKVTATLTTPDKFGWGAVSVAFSADGKTLATADGPVNNSVYLWNTATGGYVGAFTVPSSEGVNAVAFAPTGHTLAAADDDGTTYLWDTAAKRITATVTDGLSNGVRGVAFAPNGTTLATADYDGVTYLWRLAKH